MNNTENPEYWLGMRINGERYALPASSVESVFLYPESEQSLKDLRISGVVVHEGAPVYLRNHFQILRFNRRSEHLSDWQQVLKSGSAPWVVVLKDGNQIAILDGTTFAWTQFYEPFGADNYWKGGEYRAAAGPGNYEIRVTSTNNDSKYAT
jgi:hypothetical protein